MTFTPRALLSQNRRDRFRYYYAPRMAPDAARAELTANLRNFLSRADLSEFTRPYRQPLRYGRFFSAWGCRMIPTHLYIGLFYSSPDKDIRLCFCVPKQRTLLRTELTASRFQRPIVISERGYSRVPCRLLMSELHVSCSL